MENTDKQKQNIPIYDNCPICGSHSIKKKWSKILSSFRGEQYDVYFCESCKLYYIGQKLTDEFLDEFYSQSEKEELVYNDENLRQLSYYYKNLKRKIEKIVPQKGKILDIGCSGGYFLDIMDDWDRYGCEISPFYANIAKEKYGDNVYLGSFEKYPDLNDKFDVITIQDCLDHTINPQNVIAKCYKLLKPNGLIVIKVHNIDCLFAKIYGKNFYAIVPPAHLFYFSKKSMSNLLKQNNFNIMSYNFMSHILLLSTCFLRLARGNEKSIFYKIYLKLQNNCIGNIKIYKDLHDIFTVFARKKA